jgi:hypothetical protein
MTQISQMDLQRFYLCHLRHLRFRIHEIHPFSTASRPA